MANSGSNPLDSILEPIQKTEEQFKEDKDLRTRLEESVWFETYRTCLQVSMSAFPPLQVVSNESMQMKIFDAAFKLADAAHKEFVKHIQDQK